MQRDYWYSAARHPDDLDDPVKVGRTRANVRYAACLHVG
jgi:hypothetical protein